VILSEAWYGRARKERARRQWDNGAMGQLSRLNRLNRTVVASRPRPFNLIEAAATESELKILFNTVDKIQNTFKIKMRFCTKIGVSNLE
jgi:hypothetical protein